MDNVFMTIKKLPAIVEVLVKNKYNHMFNHH